MRTQTRRIAGLVAALGLLAGTLASGPAHAAVPAAASDLQACLAEPEGGTGYGCYGMAVLPGTSAAVTVRITWDLHFVGTDDTGWTGGIWLDQTPVEGQWKKYPAPATLPPRTSSDDCGYPFTTTTCYRTFAGGKGSLDLVFDPAMAGYVYQVVAHDNICTDDGAECAPSGGTVGSNARDTYVYVLKAWRYKNAKGRYVVTAGCPAPAKRTSACKPAARATLAVSVGGGVPAPLP